MTQIITKLSNTNKKLLALKIGARFTIKDDKYGDIYEVVDFPYFEPRPVQKKSWTLYYAQQHDDPYFLKCTNCIFRWRYCDTLREPGPLFCEPPEHEGARQDGKRVFFKVVKPDADA